MIHRQPLPVVLVLIIVGLLGSSCGQVASVPPYGVHDPWENPSFSWGSPFGTGAPRYDPFGYRDPFYDPYAFEDPFYGGGFARRRSGHERFHRRLERSHREGHGGLRERHENAHRAPMSKDEHRSLHHELRREHRGLHRGLRSDHRSGHRATGHPHPRH